MIYALYNLCLSPRCYRLLTLSYAFVFFVSEVVADDTPAVQAVLKADTRRLKLLEEEKQLQARLEKGEDSVAERLDKVSVFLCVSPCCDIKANYSVALTIQTLILLVMVMANCAGRVEMKVGVTR